MNMPITFEYVKNSVARTDVIFSRGENLFYLGNYMLVEHDREARRFQYVFDGNYGDYEVTVSCDEPLPAAECTCPYPYAGCKHTVAALLDILQLQKRGQGSSTHGAADEDIITAGEIRNDALSARRKRARKEPMTLLQGETCKGAHTVQGEKRSYTVTLYDPEQEKGHCTCPDFAVNQLDICKHVIFASGEIMNDQDLVLQARKEVFPFVHLTWNSRMQKPVCFYESIEEPELQQEIDALFDGTGIYTQESLQPLFSLYSSADRFQRIEFDQYLLERIEDIFLERETAALEQAFVPDFSFLKIQLYPYQETGIRFALFKKAAVIADEMGLGKTVQAVSIGILKKQVFGFRNLLVVAPASLKNQWKHEIEKFTDEQAVVISGPPHLRRKMYLEDDSLFKITNYEALMRDVSIVEHWKPDFIILDEAQRIKNFETKTHQTLNRLPKTHALVLTGTPLENRLEDLYGIAQFCDPLLFAPLWSFAAAHYMMSREQPRKILGYRNLDAVHEKLKPLVIRRTKQEVFSSLPEITSNTFFLDMSYQQDDIHQGYMRNLQRIVRKKILTPVDFKRIQKILLCMRMVCDSTYLIDKTTNISPKLVELVSVLRELVLENRRKVVIFSEWTTMTYLVGNVLSEMGIGFVEFSGKISTDKRQLLIDEFNQNPDCMVFLSSDAGGVGLNLQISDCLINMEVPWNPARLNQRIGRIHRIGQSSDKVNVINFVTKSSIEEKVYAGLGLKQELFDAVFSASADAVDLSQENKQRFLDELRMMFKEELDEELRPAAEREADQLDDQTPYFLNPEVFQEAQEQTDLSEEEYTEDAALQQEEEPAVSQHTSIDPDQLEQILNQGMAFLNTLTQAATGKELFGEGGQKAVEIDRETGEVVMRFRL